MYNPFQAGRYECHCHNLSLLSHAILVRNRNIERCKYGISSALLYYNLVTSISRDILYQKNIEACIHKTASKAYKRRYTNLLIKYIEKRCHSQINKRVFLYLCYENTLLFIAFTFKPATSAMTQTVSDQATHAPSTHPQGDSVDQRVQSAEHAPYHGLH